MPRADDHDDPHSEGTARALQMAAMAASVTEALARLNAQRTAERQEADHRAAAAASAQRQADHAAARVAWTPAGDPEWLRAAGTVDVGRAWSAAVPWAPTDPAAAAAQSACEKRLRELHPDAMRRYDWLRQDGRSAQSAMRDVAPLFAERSSPRAWPSGPAAVPMALPSGVDSLAAADRGRAGDERGVPPAAPATPGQPATVAVDEAVIGGRAAARHRSGADVAGQRAANISRTPAGMAGEGYPLGVHRAAAPGARRRAEGATTATRTATRAATRTQNHPTIHATVPRKVRQ